VLTAEPRVHAHHKHFASQVKDLAQGSHGRARIDHHTGQRAFLVDHPQGSIQVGTSFLVHQHVVRAGLDELGEATSALRFPTFLGEMAEALGRAGQIADGLAVIEEAIVRSERTEERWVIAELLRIKGELLLLQGAARSPGGGRGSLPAGARLGASARRALLGTARRHEPCPAAERPGPFRRCDGTPPAGL